MIISMTGYANAESSINGILHSIEAKSINSKFLDLSIKLPKCYSNLENDIRDIIRNKISRGKIVFLVNRNKPNVVELPLEINKDSVKYLKTLFSSLKKEAKLKDDIRIEHYLKFAEVFSVKEEIADDMEIGNLMTLVNETISSLIEMKKKEGNELKKDVEFRIRLCEEYIDNIKSEWKDSEHNEIKNLREKVDLILQGKSVDPNRIELEIALMIDKYDITEECVRFMSHLKFFRESVASKEPAGKRLNFIAQELLREANTIASKSNSSAISQYVVKIKEELEKIKEQLQNIE